MSSYYEKFLTTGEVKCIDEEIPFEIPKGWEWARINAIGVSQLGKTLDRGKESGKEYPYLCSINVYWDSINLSKIKTFRLRDDELPKYKLRKGDLLICEGGDYGRCCIWDRNEDMYYQNALYRVRFHGGLIPSFYKYVFELYRNIGYIVGQGQTIKHFTYENMRSILFPVPSIHEQKRIVSRIEEIQPIVKKYQRTEDALKRLNTEIFDKLKKSILQETIQGKLVSQITEEGTAQELLKQIKTEKEKLVKKGKLKKSALTDSVIYKGDDNKYYEQIGENCNDITDEIPFDLPYNWCWCRFSNIVSMTIGKTPARGEQTYWINGKYNWVSISDMVDGGSISTTKEKVSELAVKEVFSTPISEKGSLLMSFKLSIGKTSILDIDAYHNEAIITIRPVIDKESAMRNYLFKVLPLIANLGESKDAIKGKTLNSKSLLNLLIPLPPLQEQQRIIEQMNRLSKQLR